MTQLTQEEAMAKVSQLLQQADALLVEAAQVAKDNSLGYIEWDGPHEGGGLAGYISRHGWEPQNENWNSSYC